MRFFDYFFRNLSFNWKFYITFVAKIVTKHQSIVYVEDFTCNHIFIPDHWG